MQILKQLNVTNKSPHDILGKSVTLRSKVVQSEMRAAIHGLIESIPVKEIQYSNNTAKRIYPIP